MDDHNQYIYIYVYTMFWPWHIWCNHGNILGYNEHINESPMLFLKQIKIHDYPLWFMGEESFESQQQPHSWSLSWIHQLVWELGTSFHPLTNLIMFPTKNCMNWGDHPFQTHPYTANVVWLGILIPLCPYCSTVIVYTVLPLFFDC